MNRRSLVGAFALALLAPASTAAFAYPEHVEMTARAVRWVLEDVPASLAYFRALGSSERRGFARRVDITRIGRSDRWRLAVGLDTDTPIEALSPQSSGEFNDSKSILDVGMN